MKWKLIVFCCKKYSFCTSSGSEWVSNWVHPSHNSKNFAKTFLANSCQLLAPTHILYISLSLSLPLSTSLTYTDTSSLSYTNTDTHALSLLFSLLLIFSLSYTLTHLLFRTPTQTHSLSIPLFLLFSIYLGNSPPLSNTLWHIFYLTLTHILHLSHKCILCLCVSQ